jgi:hypothetical protein
VDVYTTCLPLSSYSFCFFRVWCGWGFLHFDRALEVIQLHYIDLIFYLRISQALNKTASAEHIAFLPLIDIILYNRLQPWYVLIPCPETPSIGSIRTRTIHPDSLVLTLTNQYQGTHHTRRQTINNFQLRHMPQQPLRRRNRRHRHRHHRRHTAHHLAYQILLLARSTGQPRTRRCCACGVLLNTTKTSTTNEEL